MVAMCCSSKGPGFIWGGGGGGGGGGRGGEGRGGEGRGEEERRCE